MFPTVMVHTIPEVMKMKTGEQKSTKELEEQAKNVGISIPDGTMASIWGPTHWRQKAETGGLWENGRGAVEGLFLGFDCQNLFSLIY